MVYQKQTVAKMNGTKVTLPGVYSVALLAALAGAISLSSPLPVAAAEWRYDGQIPPNGGPPGAESQASRPDAAEDPVDATITTLESAVAQSPRDVGLRLRLAEAHAAVDAPGKALQSCLEAVRLEPDDAGIRRQCAQYAEWAGDLPQSREQFQALLELIPDDEEGLLGAAQAFGWSGKLDQAAGFYQRYLELFPDNPDAWIQYARVRSWQGNFAAALKALDEYRDLFGNTSVYREEKARFLAWDNRPREALALVEPLLEQDPDDYERLYTRTVALSNDQRHADALASLEALESSRPDSPETASLSRFVRTPTRSTVGIRGSHYQDSDTIEIQSLEVDAEHHLTTRAALSAGVAYQSLRADSGSGFATIDGRERIRYEQTWLGGSYRFNPLAAVSGRVGHGDIQDAGDFTPYEIGLDLRPADSTTLSLRRSRALHAASPRAASLAVLNDHNELAVNWRPDFRHVVEAVASYDDLSDGNARQQFILAPRRAVVRTGSVNADLGVYLNWMSFDDDLDNGYYDPEEYQRYAGSLFGYWKINDDHGLSLIATGGFHKDDDMDDFEFGTDVALELTSGLYRDWMSVLHADYSDRFEGPGSYDGWSVSLGVTRRF